MTDASPALLSVVTVVRNDPAGLAATRASLQRNLLTVPPSTARIEWIVVDGSDPPEHVPTVQGCSTTYVHEPPAGIFEAMNRGLHEATGEWIYFLNAGDTLADDRALSGLLDALKQATRPWGVARVKFSDSRGRAISEPTWDYPRHRTALFAQGRFPPHQGTVVRTEALRSLGGFDTRYRITADYHAALQLSSASEPELWTWALAEFSQGGASSTHWRQALREMHRARRQVFKPRGWAAALEWRDTVAQFLLATAARLPTSMRG